MTTTQTELATTNCCSPTASKCEQAAQVRKVRPAVDIVEASDAVILTADLPGVDESAVGLEVDKGVLTLRARRTLTDPGSSSEPRERAIEYQRSFRLSDEIDAGAAEATVARGVLELRLPKLPEAVATKIEIRQGE